MLALFSFALACQCEQALWITELLLWSKEGHIPSACSATLYTGVCEVIISQMKVNEVWHTVQEELFEEHTGLVAIQQG